MEATLFIAWWLAFARDDYDDSFGSLELFVRFTATGVANGFGRIGQVPGAGVALAVLLISGIVLTWRRSSRADLRKRAAALVLLLVSAMG